MVGFETTRPNIIVPTKFESKKLVFDEERLSPAILLLRDSSYSLVAFCALQNITREKKDIEVNLPRF